MKKRLFAAFASVSASLIALCALPACGGNGGNGDKNTEAPAVCEHSYSEWVTGLAPTCTSMGYAYRACSVCGYKDYDALEETGHVWDGGVTVKASTATEAGLKIYGCTVCGSAKCETLELLHVMTEEEWRAAVRATVNSDNFSYSCRAEQQGNNGKEFVTEEVKINLDEGLSHYVTERTSETEHYKGEAYYEIGSETQTLYARKIHTYENDSDTDTGWTKTRGASEYLSREPEMVKFALSNEGYSHLEGLKNWLTFEMWNGSKLEDSYGGFTFDGETQAYCFNDGEAVYSLKFENGLLSEFNAKMRDEAQGFLEITFFGYGETSVTVPAEIAQS